jgi:hypothetical protein
MAVTMQTAVFIVWNNNARIRNFTSDFTDLSDIVKFFKYLKMKNIENLVHLHTLS